MKQSFNCTRTSAKAQRHKLIAVSTSASLVLALTAAYAPCVAQGSQPTSGIPGLVVSPGPSTPQPGMPGVFVEPSAPQPRTRPAPPPRKASTSKRRHSHSAEPARPVKRTTSIVALVNDDPITGYNVEERARFLALSSNIGDRARERMKAFAQDPRTNERLKSILQETIAANRGKSREQVIAAFEARKKAYVVSLQKSAIEGARASVIPTMRKKALDELIEERLKLHEAKKLSINVSNQDVDKIFDDMAKRNKMTAAEFAAHVSRQGANANVIKSRIRASLAWREVVRKRYGHQISVTQREIEDLVMQQGSGGETEELKLALITIATPGNPDQHAMAARLSEANAMRASFRGCQSMPGLAQQRANARYQDLGYKKPTSIAEPTRSLLQSAKDGEMLPPNLSASGVELYAVCGRRGVKIDEEKRQAAENQLTMQEFQKLAERYLYDLRKDALIEYR